MINAAIYPRKSKVVDNSDSMDAQIDMCKRYLDEHYPAGYTLSIYDGDYGITGHSIKYRKAFQRMMQDVSDKKIQLVLVQRYDRLARNTRDFCNIYHEMEKVGCNLVSVSQQIDTTTPYGKNFMYMQASMAELEWALNSERRKDANRYARSIGKCTFPDHCIPLGYKAERIDGFRKIVKDESKAEVVKDIFDYYGKYRNYCGTAKYISDKYGIVLSNQIVKKMVHNEIYKGTYRECVQSFCEPYLSEEEWYKLQIHKPVIRNDIKKCNEILFSGMIICPACGRKMRAVNKRKRGIIQYRYYHCEYHSDGRCTCNKVKSEILIEQMVIDYVDKYLGKYKIQIESGSKKEVDHSKEIKKIDSEIDRLNTMFLKGRISEEKYDSEYLRLNNKKSLYKTQKDELAHPGIVKIQSDWKDIYSKLDKLNKKLFWREIIKEIYFNENMVLESILFL